MEIRSVITVLACLAVWSSTAAAQEDSLVSVRHDSVSIRLVDAELQSAVQALARFLDEPVAFGNVGNVKVTIQTPRPVPRSRVAPLLRSALGLYGLSLVEDSGAYVVTKRRAPDEQRNELPPQPPIQLFVIHVRHARAADVAATVNALFGVAGAVGEVGASHRSPSLAQSLQQNLVKPVGTDEKSEPGGATPVVPGVAKLTGTVKIVPDTRTNSLLIRASRSDFALIKAAVEQLDIRPLQVLIQVIIAEVRKDRSLGLGLSTTVPQQKVHGSNVQIAGSTTGAGLSGLVLKVMNGGPTNVSAILTAGASRGDVTILDRPVILAENNEDADIMVGTQRPFVQVQRTLPTDAGSRDQVVQFKNVGTHLTVRPTISDDGYVALSVSQEVNAATAEVAFDAPVISTRTIRTQLLVKDGHTAVLGGLTGRQHDATRSGVPILSRIPLLGALFGSHTQDTTETELFIFLTPHIIRTDQDLDRASAAVGDKTKKLRKH